MAIQNPISGINVAAGLGNDYQSSSLGRFFSGGNAAVVATALSAGVPTTYTGGLVLANPTTSSVNLVLSNVTAAFIVAQANASAISLGIGKSSSALAGTLTVVPSISDSLNSTPVGILYSSASITLPTAPTPARLIGAVATGALTTEILGNSLSLNLQGGIILPPGGFACILSSAAGTASSFLGSFTWSEVSH